MNSIEKQSLLDDEQQKEAERLLEKFLKSGLDKESAKKAAITHCEELSYGLPNINDTPPDKRKSEDNYQQYWLFGVPSFINSL